MFRIKKNNKSETRKLQVTGGSTYTISLPKKWVEEFDLDSGDEMVVEEKSSSLMLSPVGLREGESSQTTIKIESEQGLDTIKRKIISLYLAGYDKIEIGSSNDRISGEIREGIKELVRKKLAGTEIISESIEKMTLQVLLNYSQLSAKGALRRMYRIAISMQENVLKALKQGNVALAEEIVELDDEIDRFQMYLNRQIKIAVTDYSLLEETGLKNHSRCMSYKLVSKHVERIADHMTLIAENIVKMENPVKKETFETIEDLSSISVKVFEKSMNSFFEENYSKAEKVIQKMEKLYEKEEKANEKFSTKGSETAVNLRLIVESVRRISEYSRNIAEEVLNLTVEKG